MDPKDFIPYMKHFYKRAGIDFEDLIQPLVTPIDYGPSQDWTFSIRPKEESKPDEAAAAALQEIAKLKAEVSNLQKTLYDYGDEKRFLHGRVRTLESQVDGLRAQLRAVGSTVASLPAFIKKNLRFLLLACHPDHHPKNQAVAAEVTRELLELKKKGEA